MDLRRQDSEMAVMNVGEAVAGRYRIERELGRGGMGVVYLAEQLAVARKVAIKVLNDSLARDAEFVSRFIGEARLLAKLSHPNIVTLHDAAFEDGRAYIVME